MLPADFDRLVARASDPRLIPGIYNYCDRWCQRCPFTDRCLTFLDSQETEPSPAGQSPADRVRASLQQTLDMIAEVARREDVDLDVIAADAEASDTGQSEAASPEAAATADAGDRHRDDPLVVSARQYGDLAWRLARALGPIVAARGDPAVIDAVGVIDWFSSVIGAKVARAAGGLAFAREDGGMDAPDEAQIDFNGSAKVALLGIAESRRAWAVLMAEGKATADGVPAQAVRMLDALDAEVRARFPRAMAFVRPGFDEGGETQRRQS
ncbi:MAG: hypothetical protein HY048_05795 [Acidobacteria bacterium]|nr:hypothetical protein [Acidobacteriota bacterium]